MGTENVKLFGSWYSIVPWVKIAGAWKNVATSYVRIAGAWKVVYQAVTVAISNQNISDSAAGAPSLASYGLANTGVASWATINSGSGTFGGEWLPSGTASNYDVRVTVNSGSLDGSSSATGSWLNLGTTRSWAVARSSVGNQSANLTVEIRDAGTLSVLDSATITLSATYS